MRQKVLILGVASVQMDAIIELKKMGYETHACAMAKDGPGAEIADYFVEINILDTESIIRYIIDNEISLVYSVGSDLAIPVACHISERLNLPHFVSENTAKICNNKDLMRGTLGEKFVGNVKFQVVKSIEEEVKLNFPFILKPTDAQGQRGVKLIKNFSEYKQSFEETKRYSRSGSVILEEYISGPELSVNGYLVNGKLIYLIASERVTWPQYTGLIHKHIVPTEKLNKETTKQLENIIELACRKLGINNGPVYAQMKLEQGKPFIIEITPRLDGCHMWNLLKFYSGINLLKLTLQHLLINDTSELENLDIKMNNRFVLEFICQEPNTAADYSSFKQELERSLYSFNYYKTGENIRPVNGRYEKIGYFIYKL